MQGTQDGGSPSGTGVGLSLRTDGPQFPLAPHIFHAVMNQGPAKSTSALLLTSLQHPGFYLILAHSLNRSSLALLAPELSKEKVLTPNYACTGQPRGQQWR